MKSARGERATKALTFMGLSGVLNLTNTGRHYTTTVARLQMFKVPRLAGSHISASFTSCKHQWVPNLPVQKPGVSICNRGSALVCVIMRIKGAVGIAPFDRFEAV